MKLLRMGTVSATLAAMIAMSVGTAQSQQTVVPLATWGGANHVGVRQFVFRAGSLDRIKTCRSAFQPDR